MISTRLQQRAAAISLVLLIVACAMCPAAAALAADAPKPAPRFESDVAPILKAYCWKCHGGEARIAELDMRSLPLLLAGGKSGPAIARGSSASSLLFQKLASGTMPPKGELRPTETHVALLRAWLEGGAQADYDPSPSKEPKSKPIADKDRRRWTFQSPRRQPLPSVHAINRVRTLVDAFLLKRLEDEGLNFSPDADRGTLVRRVYLDLIGLPPDPNELDSLLADDRPDAHDRLIDRLLASHHFGERWGRHWLDAAGYVDTLGTDNDAAIIEIRDGNWRYRDWVVRALNRDLPYDRFLTEQIAGDELAPWKTVDRFTPEVLDLLIATGYLRQAADVTYAPELNIADIRHQVLYDTVQIFASSALGLTVHCAQCHDHKFDPIAHDDYFRLAAIFRPAYDPQNWKHSKERFLWDVSIPEKQRIDAHNGDVDKHVAECNRQIAAARQPFHDKVLEAKFAALPEAIRADVKAALGTPADKRNEVQKYLADKLGGMLKVEPAEVDGVLDDAARAKIADLNGRIAAFQATKKSCGVIQAAWDTGPAPPGYVYRRGEYTSPGERVEPGVIAVLDTSSHPFAIPAREKFATSSRYRLALAQWLVQPEHPLTARVIVNRIWQHYFGRGIVATSDNFGASGIEPTHPELLDWLAVELVESGWSLKHIHRLILKSTAYRQKSRIDVARETPDPRRIDPDNRLLWRMPLRRLDSEIIRDRVLAASGALDATVGGPPVPLQSMPDGSVRIDDSKCPTPTSKFRRSLYILCRRNYQLSELGVFDQPIVAHNCTRRTPSAVVLQPLAMLNGEFLLDQATRFSTRVRSSAGGDATKRIDAAFQFALSRPPTNDERELSQDLIAKQASRYRASNAQPGKAAEMALVDLCQMLLNTSEFLYVE